MKHALLSFVALCFAPLLAFATASEIMVDLKLDCLDYVSHERIRGVITIKNISPDPLSVGYPDSRDALFVEVFKSFDMEQLEQIGNQPFVSRFRLNPNEAQRLEVFLGDHYGLTEPRRYLARPVLVHEGLRYEGAYRAFDVVPGMAVTEALQVFSNHEGLSREFSLVHWTRKGTEHLFLKSKDSGETGRAWETRDLGGMMRITKPVISILPSGKIIVLHRYGPDHFIRSEFWSLPSVLEFTTRELISDPETAGQSKVQEMYDAAGGVKPIDRPWWKFW